jgi:SnoaL-like domain
VFGNVPRPSRFASLALSTSLGDHWVGMGHHKELVRHAFRALDAGDIAPFTQLFDPTARWVGVPQRGEGDEDETPTCPNRAAILDRLEQHHASGRRFRLGKLIEDGDRVAAEITVLAPEWSGPVTLFKVFTFGPRGDVVVRLNDCIDESYALQILAA